ncbi:hypothetical protein TTHERM_00327400 (macronuclear) [Tetrahymena thermophila SB210]|uniref:Uncharacterized protein n=1 Tax=Tetrahymena thermophila (strain SB210) TaxID=312017 RepID=I7MMR5_TETTS|nr:hypothetical protein TTHERM_00327400 [Tetrahymena thermophila SB210]EAS06258.1 hypothetical protein TTHERM_00327400 [Tetrahymena thermophila SB210]|eukprot:XP_001026503.1 hypothetical protein TTHERM_00327400 [Tetrahymena thermophila SB210]
MMVSTYKIALCIFVCTICDNQNQELVIAVVLHVQLYIQQITNCKKIQQQFFAQQELQESKKTDFSPSPILQISIAESCQSKCIQIQQLI